MNFWAPPLNCRPQSAIFALRTCVLAHMLLWDLKTAEITAFKLSIGACIVRRLRYVSENINYSFEERVYEKEIQMFHKMFFANLQCTVVLMSITADIKKFLSFVCFNSLVLNSGGIKKVLNFVPYGKIQVYC